jgi:hypothetical protein
MLTHSADAHYSNPELALFLIFYICGCHGVTLMIFQLLQDKHKLHENQAFFLLSDIGIG